MPSSTEAWFGGGFRRVRKEKLGAEFVWRARVDPLRYHAIIVGVFVDGFGSEGNQ